MLAHVPKVIIAIVTWNCTALLTTNEWAIGGTTAKTIFGWVK